MSTLFTVEAIFWGIAFGFAVLVLLASLFDSPHDVLKLLFFGAILLGGTGLLCALAVHAIEHGGLLTGRLAQDWGFVVALLLAIVRMLALGLLYLAVVMAGVIGVTA